MQKLFKEERIIFSTSGIGTTGHSYEENRKSSWPGVRQRVLRHYTKAQFIKEKIDKSDFIKNKNFCSMKDTVKQIHIKSNYTS